MKTRKQVLALGVVFALFVPVVTASAQNSDPAMGTWVLNLAKSTYDPGPGPKSLTRTYEAVEGGYKFSSKGTDAEGKEIAGLFTVKFDGKYYPMAGSPNADEIMVKRVNARTVESSQRKSGKEAVQTTRVLSEDGKQLTSTSTGTNAAGKKFKNVEVFDKQ